MAEAPDCVIFFDDNPQKVYMPGQTISGSVEITIKKILRVKRLYMILEGVGESQWRGTEIKPNPSGNMSTGFVECSSVERYLNLTSTFMEYETDVEPGKYTYHFMHKLPSNLPASIMENYGGIQYRARVIFYCSESDDIKFKCNFSVLPLIDLNLHPELNIPCQQDVSQEFCCLCCTTRPVLFIAKLPSAGFIPGETIEINAKIVNNTEISVLHIKTSLHKYIEYLSGIAGVKNKREETVIRTVETGEAFSKGTRRYKIKLEIPANALPTSHDQSKVLRIFYAVKMLTKVPSKHNDLTLTFPITIGTVPFSSPDSPTDLNSTTRMESPSAPPRSISPSAPMYPDLSNLKLNDIPPPSFEEAMQLNDTSNLYKN